MKKGNLIIDGIFLTILTIIIILLIFLFTTLNYSKPSTEGQGWLPSLNLWKPVGEDFGPALNLSENDSAIEKTRQVETPYYTKIIKTAAQGYWLSFAVLFLIAVLLIAWVMIIFKIYNG